MEYLDFPFSTTILWLCQSLPIVTSTLWSKAYFAYWLTVSPFCLFYMPHSSLMKFLHWFWQHNYYFYYLFCAHYIYKVLHSKEGIHRWFPFGVKKLAKGWNHYSSLRMWEMLLFCLNQIHKTMSLQLKETQHVPMCRHSKLPMANGTTVAVGHDGVSDSWRH